MPARCDDVVHTCKTASDALFRVAYTMKIQMQQLCNARTSQLAAHFNETNRHLSSISKNTAITAHNQYVEQRLRNVDAYLLKWPVH